MVFDQDNNFGDIEAGPDPLEESFDEPEFLEAADEIRVSTIIEEGSEEDH